MAMSSRVVRLVRRKEKKPPTTSERPNHAHPTPNRAHNTAPKEPKSREKEIRPHIDPRTKGSRPQVGRAPSRGDVTAKRIDPTARTSSPSRKALYAGAVTIKMSSIPSQYRPTSPAMIKMSPTTATKKPSFSN